MDIRFTAFDYIVLSHDQEPEELQSYCAALEYLFVSFFCILELN
jgi:hypothetical protein